MDYRMELLQSMFPTLTTSSIEDVLISKGGRIEVAIDDLLALSVTNQPVKPANEEGKEDHTTADTTKDQKAADKEPKSEERELAMWMERNKTQEEDLARLEREAAQLQEELQEIRRSNENSDFSGFLTNVEEEHTTDRLLDTNYLSKLRSTMEVSELTKLGDELIMQQSELFRLKQELQEKDRHIVDKDAMLQEKEAIISQLSEKCQELEAREAVSTSQAQHLSARLHEAQCICAELNNKLQEQEAELSSVQKENSELAARIAEMEANAAALKVQLDAAQFIAAKLSERDNTEKDQLLAFKDKLQEGLHYVRNEAKKAVEEEHVKKLLEGLNKAASTLLEGSKSVYITAKNEIDTWKVLDKVSEVGDAIRKIVAPGDDDIEREFQAQLQRAIELSKLEMEILQAVEERAK